MLLRTSIQAFLLILLFCSQTIHVVANRKKDTSKPKPQPLGNAISSFKPGGQYALLTFSGGPHAVYTPQLLDILKEKGIVATFFVSGRSALLHKSLIERMVREGHDVGQQGFHPQHTAFPNIGVDFFPAPNSASQTRLPPLPRISHGINETQTILQGITSKAPRFYRPPIALSPHFSELLPFIHTNHPDLQIVLHSLDSQDRLIDVQHLSGTSAHFVEQIVHKLAPGDIVLFHDSQRVTLQSLASFLEQATTAGYEFLTLSRMLTFPDDTPK